MHNSIVINRSRIIALEDIPAGTLLIDDPILYSGLIEYRQTLTNPPQKLPKKYYTQKSRVIDHKLFDFEIDVVLNYQIDFDSSEMVFRDDTERTLTRKEMKQCSIVSANALKLGKFYFGKHISLCHHSDAPNCSYLTHWANLERLLEKEKTCKIISSRDIKAGETLTLRKNRPLITPIQVPFSVDDVEAFPHLGFMNHVHTYNDNTKRDDWDRKAAKAFASIRDISSLFSFLDVFTALQFESGLEMSNYFTQKGHLHLGGSDDGLRNYGLSKYHWMTLRAILKGIEYAAMESIEIQQHEFELNLEVALKYGVISAKEFRKQKADRRSTKQSVVLAAEKRFNAGLYVNTIRKEASVFADIFLNFSMVFFSYLSNLRNPYDMEIMIVEPIFRMIRKRCDPRYQVFILMQYIQNEFIEPEWIKLKKIQSV